MLVQPVVVLPTELVTVVVLVAIVVNVLPPSVDLNTASCFELRSSMLATCAYTTVMSGPFEVSPAASAMRAYSVLPRLVAVGSLAVARSEVQIAPESAERQMSPSVPPVQAT